MKPDLQAGSRAPVLRPRKGTDNSATSASLPALPPPCSCSHLPAPLPSPHSPLPSPEPTGSIADSPLGGAAVPPATCPTPIHPSARCLALRYPPAPRADTPRAPVPADRG